MANFDQIVVRIIKEQELIIGPLAWSEAERVQGITVLDRKKAEIILNSADPKHVVDQLVGQYERLFGRASHEVCKEAVVGILADLLPNEIPASLKG
ncbi:hypothetical protein EPN83_02105 [Patescibacteria group bacterium]|nr:MAG: hypothetical protein EPN83_02105 [Patescibacteria group bacterium]